MKKSLLICLSILTMPTMCLAQHPRVAELIKIKQQKMAELDKCAGTTKSLKIAGISTLGVTAVGIAGNIVEAKVLSDYDKKITTTDKNIEKAQKELDDKRAEILKQQEQERAAALAAQNAMMLKNVVEADIADINSKGGTLGDKAIYRGYTPERLPDGLRNRFATALLGFIDRCFGLKNETTGIAEVSVTPQKALAESYKSGSAGLYTEDYILPNLNETIFAECTVTKCLADKGFKEKTVNGVKTCVKSDEQAGNDQADKKPDGKKQGEKPEVDCTNDAKKADNNVVKAVKNSNGSCEIKECVKGKAVINGKCEDTMQMDKQQREANPEDFCLDQDSTKGEQYNCCLEIYKNKNAIAWTSVTKCQCKNNMTWNGTQCVAYNLLNPIADKNAECNAKYPLMTQGAANLCCKAYGEWTGSTCDCKNSGLEWNGQSCVKKQDDKKQGQYDLLAPITNKNSQCDTQYPGIANSAANLCCKASGEWTGSTCDCKNSGLEWNGQSCVTK